MKKTTLSAIALTIGVMGSVNYAHASAPSVPAVKIEKQPIHMQASYVGRVVPIDSMSITTAIDGQLAEVHFEEGSFVNKGDVLFSLDARPYEYNLKIAQGQLEAVQVKLETAKDELQRSEELYKNNMISDQEILARRALVKELEASLKQAEGAAKYASLELEYTNIIAPVSGRVGNRNVQAGDNLGTTPPVRIMTTIDVYDPINVSIQVNEQDLLDQKLQTSDLFVELANGDTYPLSGRVSYVANNFSPSAGTIEMRATFPNPDNVLVPGLFTKVTAVQQEAENLITIPQRAVMESQSGRYVYLANAQNQVETRYVTTGERVNRDWVISNGLSQGDVVLTRGLQLLRPGQEVEPALDASSKGVSNG